MRGNEQCCVVCGNATLIPMFSKNGYNFIQCTRCDFQRITPMPTEEELEIIYNEGTRRDINRTISYSQILKKKDILTYEFKNVLELISKWGPPGKLLDIGCAAGFFLQHAKNYGWEVFGSELSDDLADYGRRILGLSITSGNLATTSYPSDFFDVITMIGVIEHLPDPNFVADEIDRLLKKGGRLVVLTENTASLLPKILKHRWNGYMPPEHICYYSPKSLMTLFKKRGFIPIAVHGIKSELRASLGGLIKAGSFKEKLKSDLKTENTTHSIFSWILINAYKLADRVFRLLPVNDRMICVFQFHEFVI